MQTRKQTRGKQRRVDASTGHMAREAAAAPLPAYLQTVPRPRSCDDPAAWAHKPKAWRTYYGYRYRPDIGADNPKPGMASDKFPMPAIAKASVAHAERGGVLVREGEPVAAKAAPGCPPEAIAALDAAKQALQERGKQLGRKAAGTAERKPTRAEERAAAKLAERKEIAAEIDAWRERESDAAMRAVALARENAARIAAEEPAPAERPRTPARYAPAAVLMTQATAYREAAEAQRADGPRAGWTPDIDPTDRDTCACVLRELARAYGPRRAHKLKAMADFVMGHGQPRLRQAAE